MQNQSNCEISLDTQLKTALYHWLSLGGYKKRTNCQYNKIFSLPLAIRAFQNMIRDSKCTKSSHQTFQKVSKLISLIFFLQLILKQMDTEIVPPNFFKELLHELNNFSYDFSRKQMLEIMLHVRLLRVTTPRPTDSLRCTNELRRYTFCNKFWITEIVVKWLLQLVSPHSWM